MVTAARPTVCTHSSSSRTSTRKSCGRRQCKTVPTSARHDVQYKNSIRVRA